MEPPTSIHLTKHFFLSAEDSPAKDSEKAPTNELCANTPTGEELHDKAPTNEPCVNTPTGEELHCRSPTREDHDQDGLELKRSERDLGFNEDPNDPFPTRTHFDTHQNQTCTSAMVTEFISLIPFKLTPEHTEQIKIQFDRKSPKELLGSWLRLCPVKLSANGYNITLHGDERESPFTPLTVPSKIVTRTTGRWGGSMERVQN
eukprot:scaffold13509_cov157-Amphora_coffeaeformis.AAC.2